MRNRALHALLRALAVCVCLGAGVAFSAATVDAWQEQPNQDKAKDKKEPKVSKEEFTAAQAIEAAADIPTMLTAAEAFLQKFPKGGLRPQVALRVAEKISQLTDPAQLIAQSEGYRKVFTTPGEAELLNPSLVMAYTATKRYDDAFALAPTLDKSPDPIAPMINLSLAGREEARQGNPKYIAQSKAVGLRAIELVESDKKPELVSDQRWTEYKTQWLPVLYQTVAMLSHAGGDQADAKARIERAVALNPNDPINYAFIGSMMNDEYQRLAQEHKAAAAGAAKDELFKRAQARMDDVIEAYAHAIGLSQGIPQYEGLAAQLRPDLESYYKYRHNNSTEGLQALIDKYKKKP